MWIYTLAVLVVFLIWAERAAGMWLGWRRLHPLDRIEPGDGPSLPTLSIIVPALNEEATAEAAMRTLLALDYPGVEIIAVDDRSTDATGRILDRLAEGEPRLRVIHVQDLPDGWLGKSHALHLAAGQASGEWLLFTDADIHFEPTALRRAVSHAVETGADHLVVMPEVIAEGFWERVFLGFFWIVFAFQLQPRRVSDPRRPDFIGLGAFNLVRAGAYRRAGGHAAMPMEVIDDVMLGKLLKRSGARQACVPGPGHVRVRWVQGLGGAIRGLTKNLYAAARFNPLFALAGAFALFVGCIWPLAGLLIGPWQARLLCAGIFGCMLLAAGSGVQIRGLSPLYGLTFPIGAALFIYTLFRSAVVTHLRGGITWRGTFYPLARLRRGLI